jgi:hypothetical protein
MSFAGNWMVLETIMLSRLHILLSWLLPPPYHSQSPTCVELASLESCQPTLWNTTINVSVKLIPVSTVSVGNEAAMS